MVGDGSRVTKYAVARGAILKRISSDKYDSDDGVGRGIMVRVMSGTSPDIIGRKLVVNKREVYLFKNTFIEAGNIVEVIANLTFRKKNLQGQRGEVILGTDLDGDIGMEFPEDIGAGSLDGVGREGRCLYIPTDSVREISE
jgi:hypothetical protein